MTRTRWWLAPLLAAAPVAAAQEPPDAAADAPAPAVDPVPRHAQTVVLAASGGYEFTTQQGIAGLDLAFHHDGDHGFAFEGRVLGGWAFTDARPIGRVEAGFSGVVPNRDNLLVRVGLIAGSVVAVAPYPLSFQVGGVPEDDSYGHVGFMPYGLFLAELGWRRPLAPKGWSTWALGLRIGAGPLLRIGPCDDDPAANCASPQVAFQGGLSARVRLRNGLHVEAMVGPSPQVSLGYAF